MENTSLMDSIPLWALILASALGILVSIEVGYQFGRFRARQQDHEVEAPIGTMVAATLGLLAFILAFTFGLAASQFERRREVVVEEANSIGTTFLRAAFLPDSRTSTVRALLTEYVDLRLEVLEKHNIQQVLERSDELHQQLWREAELTGKLESSSIPVGLFVESLNETIDIHTKRIQVGLRNRLPIFLWCVLFILTSISMAGVGYQAGLFKSTRSPATIILILSFSLIIALIADLDRPQEGMLQVSQEAMLQLRQTMLAEK